MNCSESEQFFDAYLDDELSGSLRLEFDAHRLRCPICQQKLAMMEACEHIISRDSRIPEFSDDFSDRVMNQIVEERLVARRVIRRRLMIGAAAVLQAAAVIVFAMVISTAWTSRDEAPQVVKSGDEIAEEAGILIEQGDKFGLQMLMQDRANQLLAVRSNLQNQVTGYARYAASLTLRDELISASEAATQSPVESLFDMFAPTETEESEPTPIESGPVSL